MLKTQYRQGIKMPPLYNQVPFNTQFSVTTRVSQSYSQESCRFWACDPYAKRRHFDTKLKPLFISIYRFQYYYYSFFYEKTVIITLVPIIFQLKQFNTQVLTPLWLNFIYRCRWIVSPPDFCWRYCVSPIWIWFGRPVEDLWRTANRGPPFRVMFEGGSLDVSSQRWKCSGGGPSQAGLRSTRLERLRGWLGRALPDPFHLGRWIRKDGERPDKGKEFLVQHSKM